MYNIQLGHALLPRVQVSSIDRHLPNDGISLWRPRSFPPRNRSVDILDLDTSERRWSLDRRIYARICRSMREEVLRKRTEDQRRKLSPRNLPCKDRIQRWTSKSWIIFRFLRQRLQARQVRFPERIERSLDRLAVAYDPKARGCNLCKLKEI